MLVRKKKVNLVDVNNCANNEIEIIEKTDEQVMSYSDAVTKVTSNIIAKSEYRSLTNLH